VIGVGVASFAAHGQNVTAFNPYSGAGLPGGPLPQHTAPPPALAVDTVGPGPVAGPAFNPWSSRNPALASPPANPAARVETAASLPPPPPGPIKSRVVAVPELPTSRGKPRDAQKTRAAAAEPAGKSVSAPAAPAPAAPPAPQPAAAVAAATPPAPPPAAAAPPPQPSAPPQRQMAAVAPVPSPPPAPPPAPSARSGVTATLVFGARSTELSDASKVELDRLAKELSERTQRQVELRSVSENGDPDGRKISLARALIVRNYLIDKGVRSRIEIASIVGGGGERVEILVPGT